LALDGGEGQLQVLAALLWGKGPVAQ
jgi:hypothetical protein